MKVLLLILMIFTVFNCGETPDEKNKKKNFNATIFLAIADYMRTQDPDDQEAAENAAAIAAARALPLYDISSASLTEIQNLNLNGVVVSVNMTTGTPVVTFYITNTTNRLKGFGWTTKTSGKFNTTTGVSSATATDFITNLTSASNLQFTFAKFVPGLNGSPDKWISYLTTSVPTPNGINGAILQSPRIT
ncbi:MAG: hypothetical protein K8R21_00890 [Leptospira sp.]|nr:hypothetical protein [Leptospira sp.]